VAKQSRLTAVAPVTVRARRAYFDCRFGQLHVRTAFPTSGGFDEEVTLFCLHHSDGSSRTFSRFLPEIAAERSVYAPDLPGCGESDPAPSQNFADAAAAISDLAQDLRLRQIDLLGFRYGAGVALELGAARPELVRRLVLIGVPWGERRPAVANETLVLRTKLEAAGGLKHSKQMPPRVRFVEVAEYGDDLFDVDPKTLAKQFGAFLKGHS
jgi:pimeloyl-ACP methyl ester carboxylesterase